MNTRKTNNGNERMQGGRSRGNQRKDHFREGGMNSFHNNNYQRQKMKNSNMMNRNDSFSKSQERFDNKDSDFPVLGDSPDRRMHDRLLFVIMNMVGTKVEVTTKNGTVFEGILHGTNTESELGVCLKMAKNKTGDNNQNNSYITNLIIMGKDLAQISVTNLELNKTERMNSRDTFKTDSAISGKMGDIFERQLQKWEPEKGNYDISLELTDDGTNEKWDQFETNEKLFGITTDYDEEIYTTALDRTKSDFKKREQEAIKIAAEIEKASTENIHLAEERGQIIDESDMDEEDRYGAVIRKPEKYGKYVPPNLRKQMEANEAHHQKQLNRDSKANTFEQKKDKDNKGKTEQKSSEIKNTKTNISNNNTTSSTISNNVNNKETENKQVASNTSSANNNNSNNNNNNNNNSNNNNNNSNNNNNNNNNSNTTSTVIPPSKGPLAKIEKKTNYNDILNNKGMNQNAMQEKLVNHFRQFSKKEKEHLQQKKQAIMKKEKEGIFTEFKNFSKNFKLPDFKDLPSDNDLLASANKTGKELYKSSIEKEKKETAKKEIPKKESTTSKQPNLKKSITIPSNNDDSLSSNVTLSASAASNNNKSSQPSKSVKTPISAQVPSVSGKTDKNDSDHKSKNGHDNDLTVTESINSTASTESKSTSFKFNIEAREFKPNPSASEFVPSKNMSAKGSSQSSNDKGNIFNKRNQKGSISIHNIFVKGFLKTNNQNAKNNNNNVNQGSATWSYGSRPFKSQFSVTYEDTMYPPMDQQFGYYIQPIPYQGHPAMRRPYIPISMQPGTISYPYVPAPAYAAPMTHNRPVYPPNMMGAPMGAPRYIQAAPVMVPAYPTEMIPQFSNSIMIPQQPIIVDPGMIPGAQGMPQAVFITEQMMEVPPEQQQS